jgi:hypothetical protein
VCACHSCTLTHSPFVLGGAFTLAKLVHAALAILFDYNASNGASCFCPFSCDASRERVTRADGSIGSEFVQCARRTVQLPVAGFPALLPVFVESLQPAEYTSDVRKIVEAARRFPLAEPLEITVAPSYLNPAAMMAADVAASAAATAVAPAAMTVKYKLTGMIVHVNGNHWIAVAVDENSQSCLFVYDDTCHAGKPHRLAVGEGADGVAVTVGHVCQLLAKELKYSNVRVTALFFRKVCSYIHTRSSLLSLLSLSLSLSFSLPLSVPFSQ